MPESASKKRVFCVRNKIEKPAEEHLACPYCFGRTRESVESGDQEKFCDFDPAKDPVAFGFPEGTTRSLKG